MSQSAKQIEESEKLKNKITTKKPFTIWKSAPGKFGGTKTRGFFGRNPYFSRFHPYGYRKYGYKADQRQPARHDSEPKNYQGQGHTNPRQ